MFGGRSPLSGGRHRNSVRENRPVVVAISVMADPGDVNSGLAKQGENKRSPRAVAEVLIGRRRLPVYGADGNKQFRESRGLSGHRVHCEMEASLSARDQQPTAGGGGGDLERSSSSATASAFVRSVGCARRSISIWPMGCQLRCFRLARWEALGRVQASLRAQRPAASADRMG
jgi:hypothetical protein